MPVVPENPSSFFTEYLPARFDGLLRRAPTTSIGSLVFHVLGTGEWTLRIDEGRLVVTAATADDVLLRVTVPSEDFVPLIVGTVQRAADFGSPATQAALRALDLDPETADLIRRVPGSVLLVITDSDHDRRMLLTPGRGKADFDRADCQVKCSMSDFMDVRTGAQTPMQLFARGKLELTGNVQLALALGGVLSPRDR